MNKILVFGGAGLVGSHYCDRMLTMGYKVICVDNLSTGSKQNIKHLLTNPSFEFMNHDICLPIEKTKNEDLDNKGSIDTVINFATPASPVDYQRFPIETLNAGALGTKHSLELAFSHKARYVLISTSEVYGDPAIMPQTETYWGNVNPVGPRSVYDEAKRYAEAYTAAYFRTKNLDVRIARLFNTYGPRMRSNDGRAVPEFITAAIGNHPVPIFGDGSQTRSLCYVSDTVNALQLLTSASPNQLEAHDSETPPIINIGNPVEISMIDLAREIINLTGSSSGIHYKPLPIDDPIRRKPDISRAKRLLGWKPTVDRKNGLELTIAYFERLEIKTITDDQEK